MGSEADVEVRNGITVVIPLFNGARYIAETLTSVQQQSRQPAEVVVVDDGSSDEGPRIVRDHPVGARLVRQSHLGVAVARNRGLAEVRTRWVTFLDQDDLWHPSRLERVMDWLNSHPEQRILATTEDAFSTVEEVDGLMAADPLVGAWATYRVAASTAYRSLVEQARTDGTDVVEYFDHRDLLRGPITKTTSFVAEADLLRLAGGFAPHALAMDDYWLLVNAARLQPIARIEQPTVFYRVHLGATSRSTRLALPFLSSAVALRLGGGIVSVDEGIRHGMTGQLHEHLVDELLRSAEFRDRAVRVAVRHLAALLWGDGRRREQARANVRMLAPWLVPAVRRIRARAALLRQAPRRRPEGGPP